jgi:hypothetical protein
MPVLRLRSAGQSLDDLCPLDKRSYTAFSREDYSSRPWRDMGAPGSPSPDILSGRSLGCFCPLDKRSDTAFSREDYSSRPWRDMGAPGSPSPDILSGRSLGCVDGNLPGFRASRRLRRSKPLPAVLVSTGQTVGYRLLSRRLFQPSLARHGCSGKSQPGHPVRSFARLRLSTGQTVLAHPPPTAWMISI